MKVGIVGMPNAGKSSLFNALTKAGAEAANYPFTTIEPNVAVVPVRDERLELVVEGVGVLQTRVDDLESQIAHRIRFREAFEDHLADPLRSDLGRAALPDRRFDVVDEPVDSLRSQLLRRRLADGAGQLATVEFLARPVAFDDLDAGRLRAFASCEALTA